MDLYWDVLGMVEVEKKRYRPSEYYELETALNEIYIIILFFQLNETIIKSVFRFTFMEIVAEWY